MTDRLSIAVGDLVQIVHPTICGCPDRLGATFQVTKIRPYRGRTGMCSTCDYINFSMSGLVAEGLEKRTVGLVRLKRIPPLDELESLDYGHKLDVRQPA